MNELTSLVVVVAATIFAFLVGDYLNLKKKKKSEEIIRDIKEQEKEIKERIANTPLDKLLERGRAIAEKLRSKNS